MSRYLSESGTHPTRNSIPSSGVFPSQELFPIVPIFNRRSIKMEKITVIKEENEIGRSSRLRENDQRRMSDWSGTKIVG